MKPIKLLSSVLLLTCLSLNSYAQLRYASLQNVSSVMVCKGETVSATIQLVGTAPFSITYTHDYVNYTTISGIDASQLNGDLFTYTWTPLSSQTFKIQSASDASGIIPINGADNRWVNVQTPSINLELISGTNPSCSGSTTSYTIRVAPCQNFTWQFSEDGTNYTSVFANSVSASFNFVNTTAATKIFYLRVKAGTSGNETYSSIVQHQVSPALTAGIVTTNGTQLCHGQTLTLTSTGHIGSIRWEQFRYGTWGWAGTGNSASMTVYFSPQPVKYRAAYYSDYPACPTVYSNEIEITVFPPIGTSTLYAGGFNACNGIPTNLSPYLFGGGNVQWEQSTDGTNFSAIPGATTQTSSVTFSNTGVTTQTIWIRLKTNQPGCTEYFSNVVPCRIYPNLVAGTVTTATPDICHGQLVTLTTNGGNGTISWETDASGSWATIPNATSATYSERIFYSPSSPTRKYRVNYTTTCGQIYSNEVTVTSYPLIWPASLPSTLTICSDEIFSVTPYGPAIPGINLQWQKSDDLINFTSIAGANSYTLSTSFSNTTTGAKTVYLRLLSSNTGCGSLASNIITCTINPTPQTGILSVAPNEICEGNNSSWISLSSAVGSVEWYSSSDNINYSLLYLNGSGLSRNLGYLYTNNASETRYYRAVAKFSGCTTTSTSNTATLNIYNTIPQVGYTSDMYNLKVCTGGSILLKSNPLTNVTYQWYEIIGQSQVLIPGATSDNYQTPSLENTNTNNQIVYKTYVLIARNGACSYTFSPLNIAVHPTPSTGTISAAKYELCKDELTTLQATNASNTVTWYVSTDNGANYSYHNQGSSVQSKYANIPAVDYVDYLYYASTTNGICSAVTSAPISIRTYNASPAFSLNETWPLSKNLCGKTNGEVIRLTSYPKLYGTYVWQSSNAYGGPYTDIAGTQNTPTFTIPYFDNNTGTINTTYYRAILRNGPPTCPTKNTDVFTVNISKKLTVGTLTIAPTEVCQGTNVTATLDSYTGPIYWFVDGGSNNVATSSLTKTFIASAGGQASRVTNVYAQINLAPADNPGSIFYCPLNSNTASVTVYSNPRASTISRTTCHVVAQGGTATIVTTGTPPIGNQFKWYVKTPGATSYTYYKTTPTLDLITDPLTILGATPSTMFYEFKAEALNGPCTATSYTSGSVFVRVVPADHEVQYPAKICNQTSVLIKVKDYGQSSVKIYNGSTLMSSVYFNNASIPGYYSATVPITATTTFRLVSDYGAVCADFSNTFTIIKESPLTTPASILGPDHICTGIAPITYSVAPQTGATYTWTISPTTAGSITNTNEVATFVPSGTYFGNVTVGVTLSNTCGTTAIKSKIAGIHQLPTLAFVGLPTDVCQSTPVVQLTTTITGTTFSGNSNILGNTFNPVAVGPATIIASYTDPATTCSTSTTATIQVRPLPVVDAGPDQVLCQGVSTILNATGTGASTYTWNKGVVNGISFIPEATTYIVTARSSYGCTTTDNLTITLKPNPVIASISNKTICGNTALSIPLSSSNLPASSFSWTSTAPAGVSGNTSGSGNTITDLLLNTGVTASVNYVVTASINGCTGTTSFNVTVNPSPVIVSTISNTNPCPHETFTYIVSKNPGFSYTPSTPSGYNLVFTNNTSSTQVVYTFLPDMVDRAVGITVQNTTTGCTSTESKPIDVKDLPILTAPAITVCAGAPASISISSNDPLASYSWSSAYMDPNLTGLPSSGYGNSIAGTPEGSGTAAYLLYTTGGNGCSSYTPLTTSITVNPNPTHTVNFPKSVACEGELVTIHVGTPANPPGFYYSVTQPAGFTYSGSGGSPQGFGVGFNAGPNSGVFTVNSINSTTGCGRSSFYPITVNPVPSIPVVSYTPSGCAGTSGNYEITKASGITYSSTFPSGILSDPGTCIEDASTKWCGFTFGGAGGNLIVTATNSSGCSKAGSFPINILPSPTVDSVLISPICPGSTTSIALTSPAPGSSFSWTATVFSGNVTGYSNGTGSMIAQTLSGNGIVQYTVSATNPNGCTAPARVMYQSVNTLPVSVTVTANPGGLLSSQAGTTVITFTANVVNGGTNPTYQWKRNGANVGTNSPIYQTSNIVLTARGATGTEVQCLVTSNLSCVTNNPALSAPRTISCINCKESVLEEIDAMDFTTIPYPNPFNDFINLNIPLQENESAKIVITDLKGSVVETLTTDKSLVQMGHTLANGAYFLNVILNNGNKIYKIIKID